MHRRCPSANIKPETTISLDDRLNQEFVAALSLIQQKYTSFNRHIQIRIQKWVEKLLLCDSNTLYRKRRNQYISLLLEMVQRDYICAIFMKMPPSEVPNITDSQFRMIMQEVKKRKKVMKEKHQLIEIKKIEEPVGDTGTCSITPSGQTDRQTTETNILHEIQNYLITHKHNEISQKNTQQRPYEAKNTPDPKNKQEIIDFLKNIEKLIKRNEISEEEGGSQHRDIISSLRQHLLEQQNDENWEPNSNTDENEELGEEEQLRIEQGINRNNLLEYGSPRGTTQMQYLKAAFQF